jgi:hypothetical protein
MVRGNHETCGRAGAPGWARLMAPERQAPQGCTKGGSYRSHKPYAVRLGDLSLVVVDSAEAKNEAPLARQDRGIGRHGGTGDDRGERSGPCERNRRVGQEPTRGM